MIYILVLIQIVLLVILFFVIIQFYNIVFKGFAPFISTKFNAIISILKELDLSGDECVYELGAGSAGFLRAIEQKFKNKKLIGVENSYWPYFLTKIQISLSASSIKLIKNDIFKVNLKEADIIYCFLNSKTMNKLAKKFKEECRPNTLIISYIFQIKEFEYEKVIKDGSNNIYFYRI